MPFSILQERTGDETEEYVDGGCNGVPLSMPLLNVVSVRVPGGKHSGGQVIQLTLRNDTTTRQLLGTVCEVGVVSYNTSYICGGGGNSTVGPMKVYYVLRAIGWRNSDREPSRYSKA